MPVTLNIGAMRYKKANGEYDGFNSLGYPTTVLPTAGATAGQVPTADGQGGWAWADKVITHTVTGTTPEIVAQAGHRYVCGEVAAISITPPASGICDVVFTSGTTPAVLTVPNTVQWSEWFDPTTLAASTTYELNIMDGLGVVSVWA